MSKTTETRTFIMFKDLVLRVDQVASFRPGYDGGTTFALLGGQQITTKTDFTQVLQDFEGLKSAEEIHV